MSRIKIYILLFFILVLGLFLRIYNIENAPPGVYPDEAVNGIDAISALNGNWQWFYPANNGREGLFMNLIALCFKFFGISVLTLKLPSIIFGTLTILGVYLLAKELFQNRRIGLISAFLTAVSFWAINFSRISFRANMLPAILSFAFYFLWKGLRTKKWFDFAAGGLIFGIGLHTYISFRIAPAILVAALFFLIISRENFLRDFWKKILIFIFFTAVTSAPMLYTFFVSHPEYLESRSASISILTPEVNQGHLFKTFLKSFSLSILKYNFWGDQNWRHNFPPYAILDPLTGIAFLFGLIYSLIKFTKLFFARIFKKERNIALAIYAFLILWFFAMLAPEFMTAEGNPHALRAIGTLPVAMIFSAMTFEFFYKKVQRHGNIFRFISASLMILIFLSIGAFNAVKYHIVWAKKQETAQSFNKNLMEVSAYMKTVPNYEQKYIIAESMQRIPIQLFNQNMPNVSYFYPGEVENISPSDENDFAIIATDPSNWEIISKLQSRFPNLTLEEKKNDFGTSFYILKSN